MWSQNVSEMYHIGRPEPTSRCSAEFAHKKDRVCTTMNFPLENKVPLLRIINNFKYTWWEWVLRDPNKDVALTSSRTSEHRCSSKPNLNGHMCRTPAVEMPLHRRQWGQASATVKILEGPVHNVQNHLCVHVYCANTAAYPVIYTQREHEQLSSMYCGWHR